MSCESCKSFSFPIWEMTPIIFGLAARGIVKAGVDNYSLRKEGGAVDTYRCLRREGGAVDN
jgi:hypothetical protein